MPKETLKNKIWNKIITNKIGDCWVWEGAYRSNGSPVLYWRGKCINIQRLMYEGFHEYYRGRKIIHTTCSVGSCVNPFHLYLTPHNSERTVVCDPFEILDVADIKNQLLDKTRKSKEEFYGSTACWEWQGGIAGAGYGVISFSAKCKKGLSPKVKQQYAHRISYLLYVGEIEQGKEINHICNNKKCINPAHLEAITHQENCAYRGKTGSQARGSSAKKF